MARQRVKHAMKRHSHGGTMITTECGVFAYVYTGIDYTGNTWDVTCKRCLKVLKKNPARARVSIDCL